MRLWYLVLQVFIGWPSSWVVDLFLHCQPLCWWWDAEWDAKCPGLDAACIQEAEWKAKEQSNFEQWVTTHELDDEDDSCWKIPDDDPRRKEWIELDSRMVISYPAINWGWPSMERGVEVSIEVHSDLKDFEEECPACRLPMLIDSLLVPDLLSSLHHSTVGTSDRSCTSSRSCCRADLVIVSNYYVA
jgi:hypothetical protein